MYRALLFGASLVLVAIGSTSAESSGFSKVRSVRVHSPSFKKLSATQFLAVDRKDRLYLLRGDNLDVFRVRTEVEPEPVGRLACAPPEDSAYSAAMDPAGSNWVVGSSPWEVEVCDLSKSVRPTGFSGLVSSVTFSKSGPLVAVVPGGNFGPDGSRGESQKAPRVLKLEEKTWKTAVATSIPNPRTPFTQLKAEADTLICTGPKSGIWLASWNAYRVQEASAFERPKRELLVGNGKVKWAAWSPEEKAKIDADARKKGLDPGKNQATGVPENILRAMVCGRDGLIYLFVTTDKGLALDRFDPSLQTLERVLLEGVKVGGGPMTAVLSSGEIVFGGRFIEEGLWRLSLDDIPAASWKPVPGARLNGKALD